MQLNTVLRRGEEMHAQAEASFPGIVGDSLGVSDGWIARGLKTQMSDVCVLEQKSGRR